MPTYIIVYNVAQPELDTITGVDGSGELAPSKTGWSKWLIVPYSEAAPITQVDYDVGGKLFYSVNGQDLEIDLFPDRITVYPDPELHLNYFLEKNIMADDPFTPSLYSNNLLLIKSNVYNIIG